MTDSNFVTKWVTGVLSTDSTVHFVFKCACFLYCIHCYRSVTANNKTALVVLLWSVFPSPETPLCSTFSASPLLQYYRRPHPHAAV